jgi:hypothetical protein
MITEEQRMAARAAKALAEIQSLEAELEPAAIERSKAAKALAEIGTDSGVGF